MIWMAGPGFEWKTPLRHRVVARTAPGMAAEDAADGQVESFEGAVFFDGLHGILRAGGREAARRAQHGRYAPLVEVDGEQQELGEQSFHDSDWADD